MWGEERSPFFSLFDYVTNLLVPTDKQQKMFGRRSFLSLVSGPIAACAALPLMPVHKLIGSYSGTLREDQDSSLTNGECWLDVCAPFVVEDYERGIHTDIVLTSDTFAGVRGYEGDAYATNYEIYLYDSAGNGIGQGGMARKLTVPAMHTTVIKAQELVGDTRNFWGGMKVRLKPQGSMPMHASDLFSSAFVRWQTESSFDNVHANPDPLQWQRADSFYYSMPFPLLAEYSCTLALFNPYTERSAGVINLYSRNGIKVISKRYDLKGHSSLLMCLNTAAFGCEPGDIFNRTTVQRALPLETQSLADGGMLAITNDPQTTKSFGYLLIRQPERRRFSVEHPIHQNVFVSQPEKKPLDDSGNFKAKNVLYSPLVFNEKRLGSITLQSRCFLSTGLPIEQVQWFYPFLTGANGSVVWQAKSDVKLSESLPAGQLQQGLIRLPAQQSCMLDFGRLTLEKNFSGGLALAVNPDTTHTLMKIEVRVPEWGAHAFTHLRPGLRSARGYQKPDQRGGIATDYVTSGARLEQRGNEFIFDELIGVMNIDDKGVEGQPQLEVFGYSGLLTRVALGTVPGFACRHYLLSELAPAIGKHGLLTLRLVDTQATLLMSILHIDRGRRDIALDHGSDRFSTLIEYNCNGSA